MRKQTGKKRGRPRKPVFEITLSDAQRVWEPRLRLMGNPQLITSKFEVSEQSMPWTDREPSGRKIRPTKVRYGESVNHRSFTRGTDPKLSLLREAAADESIELPATWVRFLGYMNVIAEAKSPDDKGEKLKQFFLEDARSRCYEQPPTIPAELGTPSEFKTRLAGHEMELRYTVNRQETTIRIHIYQLPPAEDEDLDPADEPAGHWEGLTWHPDTPK
jgi:hypothetical protein